MPHLLYSLAVLLILIAAGARPAAALQVVTTTPGLAALVQAVGGDTLRVTAIARHTEDPHYVDARPNHLVTLRSADLLVAHGLEYEVGWLPQLQVNARNPRIQVGGRGYLEVSAFVRLLDVPQGPIDRAMGDLHPGGNPHFTRDPRAMASIALGVAERLAELRPGDAEGFRLRGRAVHDELLTFAQAQRERFGRIPPDRRRVIAYHKSLTYLWDWLGLEEVATLEPRPGIPPNPQHVQEVRRHMQARGVRLIVQERFYPARTAQTLASLTGARLLLLAGDIHFDGGETLIPFFQRVADDLYTHLQEDR